MNPMQPSVLRQQFTQPTSPRQQLVEALVNRRKQIASDPLAQGASNIATVHDAPAMATATGDDPNRRLDAARAYRQAATSANHVGIGSIGGRGSKNIVPTDTERFAYADELSQKSVDELENFLNVVTKNIIGKESTNDADARNPRSSATGLGQFTEETWLRTIAKHRPDLMDKFSKQEVLAMRTDPQLSRAMTRAHTLDNVMQLSREGIEITPGNTYLAHFLGVDKAIEVMQADPQSAISRHVSAAAIAANPTVLGGGESVQNVRDWADKKMALSHQELGNPMGAIPTPSPGGANLSPQQQYVWAGQTRDRAPAQPMTNQRQTVSKLVPKRNALAELLSQGSNRF